MTEDRGDKVAVLAFHGEEVGLRHLDDPFKFMLPEFVLEGGVKKVNVHLAGMSRVSRWASTIRVEDKCGLGIFYKL